MAHTPDLPHFFEENINLEGLFDILSPKNNLVLADDMMLSDADGIILRVSENYERNFGFTHDSIVGKSAFDLEANGTFRPCITAEVIRQKKKITATQTINHTHKNVMTVGIPLFDQNGVLKYAVCFNTVSMEQINAIHQNYRHLQDSLQQYSQEILLLESKIFEIRNAKGRLIDRINTIEQEWVLASLNGAAPQPAEPAEKSLAEAVPDSLKVRNLVDNLYFREHLPAEDYAALRKALAALPGALTVFIVSQRAASLQHADQIIVLDDGRMVGLGRHAELLDSCPVYREIYESQFKKGDAQK